jgi:RNA polymerase sigma factor (TIGR02999 family)
MRRRAENPQRVAMADDTKDLGEMFPLVYSELRKVARNYLGRETKVHTLQPTALVNEAWLRLRDAHGLQVHGRTHVLGLGARAMRRILVDHGRSQQTLKRGARPIRLQLDNLKDTGLNEMSIEDALTLDEVLTRLESIDPRQAQIVTLRYFAGMSVDEVAEHLRLSKRTVEGEWTHAKAWLKRELTRDTDQG